jgi:signal transduction histidine kinase
MTRANKGDEQTSDPLADLGHLSDSVAHHIINAFAAIVSNAELIRARAGAGDDPAALEGLASSMIETALDASQVGRRLIDWTRHLTAVDGSQAGHRAAAVDMNQLIQEMLEAEQASGRPALDWVLHLASIPPIPGDLAQLRSMLGHLMRNAREALPGGHGTVTFSTLCDAQNWVTLSIRDSGGGMAQEVLRRATEPFFTTKPGHCGIGLTIAQRIWRRHRGSFSIDSRPDAGTTVRLSIGPIG